MNQVDILKQIKKKDLEKAGFFLTGYDNQYSQLSRIISKKGVNNAVIVGDGGVGKTTLAKSIALDGAIEFYVLQNDVIAELIFSYQPSKDDVQETKRIFQSLKNAVILIDDIVSLFSQEDMFQNRSINLLTSLLTNRNVAVIATIDQPGYRLFIEKNPLLTKLFEQQRLFEPVESVTIHILSKHIPRFEQQYEVEIHPRLAKHLVVLANRFLQTQKQPAKSLNLLDEVCTYVLQQKQHLVKLKDIKHIISERTGIPVADINLSDRRKLQRLGDTLSIDVKGQDHAIERVTRVIRRSRAGIQDPRRPSGSFLFLGPSGVGKTHLAKTLTKTVYGDEQALVRIDMSEFNESHNVQRLIGAPPGYVGYEEGGQLTNPVWERPYSLILLDEIEKAHPRVFDIFLQLIDEGRLTDGQGKTVDFNNTIIIATSNIGIDHIIQHYQENGEYIIDSQFVQKEMMPILLEYFRPEFINRFDDIVVFKPLDIAALKRIAYQGIEELNTRLSEQEIRLQLSDDAIGKLVAGNFNPKFGARPLKRAIREQIEDYIAQKIIFGELERGSVVEW